MSKFAKACILSYEEWVATIPAELPEPEYSKKHIRRMNALKNKMRGNVYHHFTTRTIKVMLVAAILLALLMTAFIFPSSRESIVANFNIVSRYQMTKENRNSVPDEITVGYIPEGFKLESKDNSSKASYHKYTSSDNIMFTVYKSASSGEIHFDTETQITEEIIIENTTYLYYVNVNGLSGIIWIENDYIYRINGSIPQEELINIAKTVE